MRYELDNCNLKHSWSEKSQGGLTLSYKIDDLLVWGSVDPQTSRVYSMHKSFKNRVKFVNIC